MMLHLFLLLSLIISYVYAFERQISAPRVSTLFWQPTKGHSATGLQSATSISIPFLGVSRKSDKINRIQVENDGAKWLLVTDMWETLSERIPNEIAIVDPIHGDSTIEMNMAEVNKIITGGAAGFQKLGIVPGDCVSVFSENSHRWLLAEQSIMKAGCCNAVRGAQAPIDELKYIYQNSKSVGLVVETPQLLESLLSGDGLYSTHNSPPKFIIVLYSQGMSGAELAAKFGTAPNTKVLNYDELLSLGTPSDYKRISRDPSSTATLVYTSGTQARPKGVILRHSNLMHQIKGNSFNRIGGRSGDKSGGGSSSSSSSSSSSGSLGPGGGWYDPAVGDVFLSILPCWHIFERTAEYWALARGGKIVYSNLRNFKNDFTKWRPHYLVAVPRLLENIHKGIVSNLRQQSATKRRLISIFTAITQLFIRNKNTLQNKLIRNSKPNILERLIAGVIALLLWPLHKLGDTLVWKKIRQNLGGRLKVLVSGGSTLPMQIDSFFDMVGLKVVVGYGLTETSPVIASRLVEHNVLGSVGRPTVHTRVKIVDPETRKEVPYGEPGLLLAHGPGITSSYMDNEEATRSAFDKSDFFDTGDIARFNPATGDIIITGRAKDVIVLSNGENVAPPPKTLDLLLETTFVATVDSSTLSLIAPLLGKVLRGRSSPLKRKAARVIDNMCRLVTEPSDVAPFVPLLLPALDKVIDEIVDAEVRDVAIASREVLLHAMGQGGVEGGGKAKKTSTKGASTPSSSSSVNNSTIDFASLKSNMLSSLLSCLSPNAPPPLLPSSSDSSTPPSTPPATPSSNPAPPPPPSTLNPTDLSTHPTVQHIASLTASLVAYISPPNPNLCDIQGAPLPPSDLWRAAVATSPHNEWRDCIYPFAPALLSCAQLSHLPSSLNAGNAGSAGGGVGGGVGNRGRSMSTSSTASIADEITTNFCDGLVAAFREAALGPVPDVIETYDADEANVCDFEFSLAFGGKILLHNTRLRLGKGHRYAVMGKNGAGKTTLLTNIGTGNIEGMPPHLRMMYVQHDDPTDDLGQPLLTELLQSKDMIQAGVSEEDARGVLTAINFTSQMLASPRSSLSGGWKMKLLIAKAMLYKPDILLLDEPTNHLDAASVQWLTDYCLSLSEVTCLIVSHDIPFLDKVVTDVIHYEEKKLVYYKGNMTHFVSIHPEAQFYYDLQSSSLSFKFPVPERLEGINSSTRSVLTMTNVTFTYPKADNPTLTNVSVKLCLGSRIAVTGANGAGKSTLIKLLVQETEPDAGSGGEIWKHHNLRVAYVAQHSFHHVEQHLDSSPVDYFKWRFAAGVDREDMTKTSTKLTDEEQQEIKTNRKYGDVLEIVGRRKNGKTMEYECTFVGQTPRDENKYIAKEKLEEAGLGKLVQQCDTQTVILLLNHNLHCDIKYNISILISSTLSDLKACRRSRVSLVIA